MKKFTLSSSHTTSRATKYLESFESFDQRFQKKKDLGIGADGVVRSYQDAAGSVVAVKTPNCTAYQVIAAINQEANNLQAIGKHENITDMLAVCRDFRPIGPAIIFEMCDLGDVNGYVEKVLDQQHRMDRVPRVPEATMLKLLWDVSLGLDFLHNANSQGWVHGDLKPGNILVCRPPGCADPLPHVPLFKLTDFGRMSMYPEPEGHVARNPVFQGTCEFAPPASERTGVMKPAIDIWALGAIIQFCALLMDPVQSRASVKEAREMRCNAFPCPDLRDDESWESEYWRKRREVIYRPINVEKQQLIEHWDIDMNSTRRDNLKSFVPYSNMLQYWYKMLIDPNPETRITSAQLKKVVVPFLPDRIEIARKMQRAQEGLYMASELRAMAESSATGGGKCPPEGDDLIIFSSESSS